MSISSIFFNQQEKRSKAVVRLLAQSILSQVLILLFIGIFAAIIGSSFKAFIEPATFGVYLFGSLASLMATMLSLKVAARYFDKRNLIDYILKFDGLWLRNLVIGLTMGLVLAACVFFIEWLNGWVTIDDTFVANDSEAGFMLSFLVVLIFFVVVGITEELVFRGYIIKNVAEGLYGKKISPKNAVMSAVVISSTVFGLVHAGNPEVSVVSIINIIFAGLFMGLFYVWTGSLALPIGLHITWNFSVGNIFGFPVSGMTSLTETATVFQITQSGPEFWTGGKFGPEGGLVYLLVWLVGAGVLWLWVKNQNDRGEIYRQLAVYESTTAEVVLDDADDSTKTVTQSPPD